MNLSNWVRRLKAAGLVESGVDAKFAIRGRAGKGKWRSGRCSAARSFTTGTKSSYDGETVTITKLKDGFMIIESIELKNYRNYGEFTVWILSPGTNILYGDNAQGKDQYP